MSTTIPLLQDDALHSLHFRTHGVHTVTALRMTETRSRSRVVHSGELHAYAEWWLDFALRVVIHPIPSKDTIRRPL